MTSENPIEDQILIDLFRYRRAHGLTSAKPLTEYHEHSQVIARLVSKRDIEPVGNDQFRITAHGQQRIIAKYPALEESSRPSYLRYEPKPRERKAPRGWRPRQQGRRKGNK